MPTTENKFYVYIYLNPLKPGQFTYGDFLSFQYEPFYVGKGQGDRMYGHLKEKKSNNKHKFYTIQKIKTNELEPIIIKLNFNLSKEYSSELEKLYIKTIGRADLNLGPLTNMTNGGDGGDTSKSPQYKLGMSKRRTYIGEGNPRYGLPSPMKGKKHNINTIKLMSEKTSEYWTEEKRNNQSKNLKGENNPMYGKSPANSIKVTINGYVILL